MRPEDALLELPILAWEGPFDAATQARAVAALEQGKVLVMPRMPFVLRNNEQEFLSASAADNSRKNVSYDHTTQRLHGTAAVGEERDRLTAMVDRFGRGADALVRGLFPGYAPHLQRARTSFRPIEISGRKASERHDDTLLHVDAFPTRPLRGRRILRVFSNVAPGGVLREWRVGEPFEPFARRFLPRLKSPWPGEAWVLARLGLTKGTRSRYDHLMLQLHDAAKHDRDWQHNGDQAAVSFPPGTSWMCYTDSVLHAAMAGRCALEQTFHLPVAAMAYPEQTPLRVLERLTGRELV